MSISSVRVKHAKNKKEMTISINPPIKDAEGVKEHVKQHLPEWEVADEAAPAAEPEKAE